ncbi:uncharacterized protein TNCV_424781 [Trichonephila clavipes]|nr:uncharacterized protein TNCV_424781 [Trichonephila clavipes]
MEWEERCEVPDHHQDVLPQNYIGTEPNHAVTCMVLKATTKDRRRILDDRDRELFFRGLLSRIGRYQGTLLRICNRLGQGRSRATKSVYVWYLSLCARRNRTTTPAELRSSLAWIATLTALPSGLGSNPGEAMDVCKCAVPLRQGGILNSRRAANPLAWLVEGEESWEVPVNLQGFLPLNWGVTEQNRTVPCMMLKAKANDRRKNSSP